MCLSSDQSHRTDQLTLHVRVVGGWTRRLHSVFEEGLFNRWIRQKSTNGDLKVNNDGSKLAAPAFQSVALIPPMQQGQGQGHGQGQDNAAFQAEIADVASVIDAFSVQSSQPSQLLESQVRRHNSNKVH